MADDDAQQVSKRPHFARWLFGDDEALELRAEYNRNFFRLQKSEFASFGIECADTPEGKAFTTKASELERRLRDNPKNNESPVLLAELFEMEMLLLRAMPESAVRAKVWSARSTYQRLVGNQIYNQYMSTMPPDPKHGKSTEEEVRSDLIDIIKGKHWWYVNAIVMEHGMKRHRESLRRWLISGLIFLLVFNLLLSIHVTGMVGNPDHGVYGRALSAIFLSIYAGILGATISIARRVKEATDVPLSDTDPVIRLSTIVNGNVGIQLSMIMGGAFALVLFFVFVSGAAGRIFVDDLIPHFQSTCASAGKCENTLQTFLGLIPDTAKDLGKLLVWCFIAGFAEKFVPDILDKLASTERNNRGGGMVALPSPPEDDEVHGAGAESKKGAGKNTPPPPPAPNPAPNPAPTPTPTPP
jgi:hypothetical protein